jgi:hypothetical protein
VFDEKYEPSFGGSSGDSSVDTDNDRYSVPFLDKTVRIQGVKVTVDDDPVKYSVPPHPDSISNSPDTGIHHMGVPDSQVSNVCP